MGSHDLTVQLPRFADARHEGRLVAGATVNAVKAGLVQQYGPEIRGAPPAEGVGVLAPLEDELRDLADARSSVDDHGLRYADRMIGPASSDDPLVALNQRLTVLLPEVYRDTFQDLTPVPMRSAGLVYAADGRVAWDRMWGSFCDLAMAGGPPHKGRWLAPPTASEVAAEPDRYEEVVAEVRRGVGLVTGLDVRPAAEPGWVPVVCYGEAMAEWLARAIVMENVAARRRGTRVEVPAAPSFRLEKEIRNVVTVVAKTCHYWVDHMPYAQQAAIRALFEAMETEAPVVPPADAGAPGSVDAATTLATAIASATGLAAMPAATAGWVGVPCRDVVDAIWMMRALVASNVYARREEATLLVPANVAVDGDGTLVAARVARVHVLLGRASRS